MVILTWERTDKGSLRRIIEEKADKGVQLTILGFGMGNLKDDMLETLSNYGDGNYGYIDSMQEARKLFAQRLLGTLIMIAKDVKIQVEFNPLQVAAYRLIGYENRLLKNEDFEDDEIDAGDIGSGHTVTALYEIVPPGVELPKQPGKIELRYQKTDTVKPKKGVAGELMNLKLRYKWPKTDESYLIETPVIDGGAKFEDASPDMKFAPRLRASECCCASRPTVAIFHTTTRMRLPGRIWAKIRMATERSLSRCSNSLSGRVNGVSLQPTVTLRDTLGAAVATP